MADSERDLLRLAAAKRLLNSVARHLPSAAHGRVLGPPGNDMAAVELRGRRLLAGVGLLSTAAHPRSAEGPALPVLGGRRHLLLAQHRRFPGKAYTVNTSYIVDHSLFMNTES